MPARGTRASHGWNQKTVTEAASQGVPVTHADYFSGDNGVAQTFVLTYVPVEPILSIAFLDSNGNPVSCGYGTANVRTFGWTAGTRTLAGGADDATGPRVPTGTYNLRVEYQVAQWSGAPVVTVATTNVAFANSDPVNTDHISTIANPTNPLLRPRTNIYVLHVRNPSTVTAVTIRVRNSKTLNTLLRECQMTELNCPANADRAYVVEGMFATTEGCSINFRNDTVLGGADAFTFAYSIDAVR